MGNNLKFTMMYSVIHFKKENKIIKKLKKIWKILKTK